MADESFRLPKSSYDELVKIIRAYGSSDRDVSLPELKQSTGMHETIISSNNAFLMSVGLIEGGKSKKPTAKGRDLAIALQHDMPDQVSHQPGWSLSTSRAPSSPLFTKGKEDTHHESDGV